MEIFEKVLKYFKGRFGIVIFVITLLSYGQIIKMLPWQDDNAIFFKLAHIKEPAGYLGKGILGEGPYKYTAFFYYPIYLLFGYRTEPYFILSFIFYLLSTLVVYRLFKEIINEKAAKVASFIYACGFVASDGYIRLYNSVGTSLSIIFISFLFYFYWRFCKSKNIFDYIVAFIFFLLATEFVRYRSHYLISIVFIFEVLFFTFSKPLFKSLRNSLFRLLPFSLIFYKYYILNSDPRSGQIIILLKDLLKGNLYKLFGFLTSLSNLFIPDTLTNTLLVINEKITTITTIRISYVEIAFLLLIFVILIFNNKQKKNYLIKVLLLSLPFLVWAIIYKDIFVNPSLVISGQEYIELFFGGILLILSIYLFRIFQDKQRKKYVFLILWLIVNVAAYAAYNPTFTMVTINRYLAHSFLPLTGIFGLIYVYKYKNKNIKKVVQLLLIFLGLLNLWNSVKYQNLILKNRTKPVVKFYLGLKSNLPEIKKGDVIYFDVADNALGYFADAFSVAQMPETTAIAWRYGIDRYDFQMFTDYFQFRDYINENKIGKDKIKTFFYDSKDLSNTSDIFISLFENKDTEDIAINSSNISKLSLTNDYSIWYPAEVEFKFKEPIKAILPVNLLVNLSSKYLTNEIERFPLYSYKSNQSKFFINSPDISQIYNYFKDKNLLINKTIISTSSEWQGRVTENLSDNNYETMWQPDRVLWENGYDYIEFSLPNIEEISKVVWVNGYTNETPSKYRVEYQNENGDWIILKSESNDLRFEKKEPREISFVPTKSKRFRLIFTKTINDDAPTVAEAWIVSSKYSDLNISKAEEIISDPLQYVANYSDYLRNINFQKYLGKVQVYWISDKGANWQTSFDSQFNVLLDGKQHVYKVFLPINGTKLEKIKFVLTNTPSILNINNISISRSL